MEAHELAGLVPAMSDSEYIELKEDIRQHGQAQPILLYEGRVLDGRHRDKACAELGIACQSEAFEGSRDDAIARVISLNIKRRHLSGEQKRQVIASTLKATPEMSDRAIADAVGVSHHTVNSVRQDLSSTGQIAQLDKTVGKDGRTRTTTPKPAKGKSAPTKVDVPLEDRLPQMEQVAVDYQFPPNSFAARNETGDMRQITIFISEPVRKAFYDAVACDGERVFPALAGFIARTIKGDPEQIKSLAPSAQEKLVAAIRQQRRQLNLEFDDQVREGVRKHMEEQLLPHLNKKLADAERIIKGRKGLMTKAQYRQILMCLHPDHVQDAEKRPRYAEAFALFRSMELLLCDDKQMPTSSGTLPKTVAELLARKKTRLK